MSAILAIGIAKTLLQHDGFTPCPEHLQDEDWGQSGQEPWAVQIKDESGQDQKAENVNGIADPRIEPVSDERGSLRRDGEGVAKLNARDDQQDCAGDKESKAKNMNRAPDWGNLSEKKSGDRHHGDDGNEASAWFHSATAW